MRRFPVVACAALLAACDFGTLADLNEDTAAQGGDEVTAQALDLWRSYDTKTDDKGVARILTNVQTVVQHAGVPTQSTLGPLAVEDTTAVGIMGKDPNNAQGMLLITELDCPLAVVEKYVVAKNQTDLYPGLYDSYTRTYIDDPNAFLAAASPTVSWHTDYQATALSRTYIAGLTGSARFVNAAMPNGAPVLLARTVLNAPAKFTAGGDDSGFDQDYQIELYYEDAPGKTIHFYALWRDFHIGSVTSQTNLYINVVLGNLEDFDTRTNKICKENNPTPTFQ